MSIKKEPVFCKICNQQTKYVVDLFSRYHLQPEHNISVKEYYDQCLKRNDEGVCPVCGKEAGFLNMVKGYRTYCTNNCKKLDMKNIGKKTSNTKLNHSENKKNEINERRRQTCLDRYGKDYVMHVEEFKENLKKTNIERYGSETTLQLQQVKSARETALEMYKHEINEKRKAFWTIDNIKKVNETREKYLKETYGSSITNVMHLSSTYEAIKTTNNEKYGKAWYVMTENFRNTMEEIHNWIPVSERSEFEQYSREVRRITYSFKKELLSKWNGCCYYSGIPLGHDKRFSIEHKDSIFYCFINGYSVEYASNIHNLEICSLSINVRKNSLSEEQFYEKVINMSNRDEIYEAIYKYRNLDSRRV